VAKFTALTPLPFPVLLLTIFAIYLATNVTEPVLKRLLTFQVSNLIVQAQNPSKFDVSFRPKQEIK
jgi:hypothetical protein